MGAGTVGTIRADLGLVKRPPIAKGLSANASLAVVEAGESLINGR